MKQRIHGQKVQNWHRPLGADELKQSYRVRRDADPEYPDVSVLNRGITPDFVEDEWYDSDYDDWWEDDSASTYEVQMYELTGLVRGMLQPGLLSAAGYANKAAVAEVNFTDRVQVDGRRLEGVIDF